MDFSAEISHNTISVNIEYITRKLSRQLFSPRRTLLTVRVRAKRTRRSQRARAYSGVKSAAGRAQRSGAVGAPRPRSGGMPGTQAQRLGTLRLLSTVLRSDSTQLATARSSHTQNIIKLQQLDRHLNSIMYTCLRSGSVQSWHQVNGKVQLGAGAGMRERGHGTSCK